MWRSQKISTLFQIHTSTYQVLFNRLFFKNTAQELFKSKRKRKTLYCSCSRGRGMLMGLIHVSIFVFKSLYFGSLSGSWFMFCYLLIKSHSVISYTLLKLDYLLSFPDFAINFEVSLCVQKFEPIFLKSQEIRYIQTKPNKHFVAK